MKKNLKTREGITLIALIITIIIMLILVAVTISMAIKGGLFEKAGEAVGDTKNSINEEQGLTSGRIQIDGVWYDSIDDYLVRTKIDENPGVLENIGTDIYEINSIEDLVALAYSVNKGESTYQGKTIELGKNLDFKNDLSYVNPQAKYILESARLGYKPSETGTSIKELLLGDNGFIPIGTLESLGFCGTIKGNSRVIKNMKITPVTALGGLIGKTVANTKITIRDLGIEKSDINTNSPAGSVIGWNYGTIEIVNCYNTGAVVSQWHAGGIAGGGDGEISITDCYNIGGVNSLNSEEASSGGIFGYCAGKISIARCHNKGSVDSTSGDSGGILGRSVGGTTISITDCYNAGEVNSQGNLSGGIAGRNYGGTISNCYNTGKVNSRRNPAGGIAGQNYGGSITNCYNTGVINSQVPAGGIAGWLTGNGSITNCYNVGTITSNDASYIGAVVGSANGTITNCYFMKGSATVGVGCSGTGDTTEKGKAYMTTDAFLGDLKGSTTNTEWIREDSKNNGMPTFTYDKGDYSADSKKDTNPGVLENIGTDTYEVNSIEDLVALAYSVNKGESTYQGKTIELGKNLDFKNDLSYVDPQAKYILESARLGYKPSETGTSIKELLLGNNGFIPIGTLESSGFYGTIKGNSRVIKNMKITPVTALGGLIGKTVASTKITIRDLGIEKSDINTNAPAGSVIGWNYGTIEIINCYNTGAVNSQYQAGGIAGGGDGDISITNCYNIGTVNSQNSSGGGAGGIAGLITGNSSITNCYNTGKVNSSGNPAGGIAGKNDGGSITNCYNTGVINSQVPAGGIAGWLTGNGSITNCYNVGTITSNNASYIGAIVGSASGTITNCYFMKGSATVGVGCSGTGDTTEKEEAYMKTDAFLNELRGSTSNTVWIRGNSKNNGMPTFGSSE